MARQIEFVNDSPVTWVLDELDGREIPPTSSLDVSAEVSDPDLIHAIQLGIGDEFDVEHYLRINSLDWSDSQSKDYGNHTLGALPHAATHATGGSDPVTPASIGADTPADRDAAILVHRGDPSAHHTRYTDPEALTAMGVKDNTNPYHHDRYTDAEADVVAGAAIITHTAITDAHHTRPVDYELLPKIHVPTHEKGGTDPLLVDDQGTTEVNSSLRLAPDGAGGVQWSIGTGTPSLHASTHQDGGSDEINVGGLSGELADAQHPKQHAFAGSSHTASTLADLNTKVLDANLDDSGDPRDPNAHAPSHQHGGSDEIAITAPSANGIPKAYGTGLIDAGWLPAVPPQPHASSHENGGADEISVAGLSGLLADPQNPTAHKSTHISGGSDAFGSSDLLEAAVKRIQEATGPTILTVGSVGDGYYLRRVGASIVGVAAATPSSHGPTHENGGADEIGVAGLSGLLADPQTPLAHKDTHISGGSDAFASTDFLEAIVKRLRESGGPTDLTMGAVADGDLLQRSGSSIVGFSESLVPKPGIRWSPGDNNGPGATSGSGTPTVLRYSLFPGTDSWTPNTFVVLAQTSNAARPVAFDVYDLDNGKVLAVVTGIVATSPTRYTGTVNVGNLPTGLSTIALRGYWSSQAANATVYTAFFGVV